MKKFIYRIAVASAIVFIPLVIILICLAIFLFAQVETKFATIDFSDDEVDGLIAVDSTVIGYSSERAHGEDLYQSEIFWNWEITGYPAPGKIKIRMPRWHRYFLEPQQAYFIREDPNPTFQQIVVYE
ncbi:MAG: hypothetical protein AAFN77_22175 [Planctomycetota bacterium]